MANASDAALRRFERPAARQSAALDELVRQAVFGAPQEREQARWLIWEIGQAGGVRPASIHELYLARGRGEVPPFTTPAINVRVLAYDSARAILRAARRLDVGAVICEIARSEIGYTEQRPGEYVAVMTAAALREGFTGPLFIQGDHVQVNAKKYAADPEAELQAIRTLIEEELHAGFYNIDVDTSTLVDLSKATLDEQQRVNYERAAELTKFIREREPDGVTVSVGAEIGEVGGKNSDVHELHAFMEGYRRALQSLGPPPYAGISKISVQTGTSHGGVVLPDGSIARVQLDLEALRALSAAARHVPSGRCGAARRLDAAAGRLQPLPQVRGDRDPPGDQLPEHRLRPPQAAGRIPARAQRLGQGRVQRRMEDGRHGGAVHLQEPQAGHRAVQAAAVGSAGGRAGRDRRRPREDVRL